MQSKIKFKFKWLNAQSKPASILSKEAYLDEQFLTLEDKEIQLKTLLVAYPDRNHLILAMENERQPLIIKFTGGSAKKVLKELNNRASAERARWHRQELSRLGRGNIFSSFACPFCGFTNELTGFSTSPQKYCPACDTVISDGDSNLLYERHYHRCSSCGTYGRIKTYTCHYYLIFVHAWHTYRECRVCMRSRVALNCLANLPFLLGLPLALYEAVRAYMPAFDPLAGVEAGNNLAKRKKLDMAILRYESLQQQIRHCATVRYNHALALTTSGRVKEAAKKLEEALSDCANFRPAYLHLSSLYESLNLKDRQEALQRVWVQASSLAQGRYMLPNTPGTSPAPNPNQR